LLLKKKKTSDFVIIIHAMIDILLSNTFVFFLKELTYLPQNYSDRFNVPKIQLQHITITCVHVIIDVFLGRHYHHNDLPSFYIKSQSRHHVRDPTPHNTPRVRIGTHTNPRPRYKSHLPCVHSISRTKI